MSDSIIDRVVGEWYRIAAPMPATRQDLVMDKAYWCVVEQTCEVVLRAGRGIGRRTHRDWTLLDQELEDMEKGWDRREHFDGRAGDA